MYLYGIEMAAPTRWGTHPRDVLIVPLWNWNYCPLFRKTSLKCSNCTFMELKLLINFIIDLIYCSNCTFMELKWLKLVDKEGWEYSSNCTFMELKYGLMRQRWLSRESSNCTFMELKYGCWTPTKDNLMF